MAETLKSCPFCGRQLTIRAIRFGMEKFFRYGVACQSCAICIGWADSEEEAAEKWNTRPGEQIDDPSHPFADDVMMGDK